MIEDKMSNQLKVLKTLAEKGPLIAYKIEKEACLPHSSVSLAIKELNDKSQIKVIGRERFPKTGKIKKTYQITLAGLANLFQLDQSIRIDNRTSIDVDFNKVAQANTSLLPKIFGKWKYFVEGECNNLVGKILKLIFKYDIWVKSTLEDYVWSVSEYISIAHGYNRTVHPEKRQLEFVKKWNNEIKNEVLYQFFTMANLITYYAKFDPRELTKETEWVIGKLFVNYLRFGLGYGEHLHSIPSLFYEKQECKKFLKTILKDDELYKNLLEVLDEKISELSKGMMVCRELKQLIMNNRAH